MPLDTLPDEILLDSLAPLLPLPSLLALSQVNRHFWEATSDNTLWRRRASEDFNVPEGVTARVDGFKELYGRLRRPDVYVWGASSNGRLGIPRGHPALSSFDARYDGVNEPVRLPLDPGVGIVDLHASGYGFVGLDTAGGVWIWGTLNGEATLSRSRPNWQTPGAMAPEPRHVLLPARARSVSCGRRHVLVLDEKGAVWELTSWGSARKREQPRVSASIVQIEAGWAHSAVLTSSGAVRVWWPSFDPPSAAEPASAQSTAGLLSREPLETEIAVRFAVEHADPFELPALPTGEELHFGDRSRAQGAKVVRIACGDGFVVALDENGQVWTCWVGGRADEVGQRQGGGSGSVWEQHPHFKHPLQGTTTAGGSTAHSITHVSAHFESFFAYSPGSAADEFATSAVLMGKKDQLHLRDSEGGARPQVIDELQGKGVIQIVVGDYHFGALTSSGQMFTWGSYSSGALGLGRTTQVAKPTPVSFGGDSKFVFAAAASGWHTGALVLDLSKSPADAAREREENRQAAATRDVKLAPTPQHPTLPTHPDTSRFAGINPPPSGRPLPGQAGAFFPGITRGVPTPFFGAPAAESSVPRVAPRGVARPPPRPDDTRQMTLPVQPSPAFRNQAWAEGRTGWGSQAAGAVRPAAGENARARERPAEGGGGTGGAPSATE